VRVAALYDVHGNLPALEAALAAARERGADAVVFGGDLAWGPLPAETVAAIRAVDGARHVRGNADREVAGALVDDEVTRHAVAALGDEALAWLGALPEAQVVDVDGLGPVRFVHGSPRSDEETITAVTPDERVAEMLVGVAEPVVVCGHTHAQCDRVVGPTRVINAGSVGLPFGAPGAHWALLGPGVELVVTPYDTAAAGAAFLAAGGPEAADFAEHAAQPPPASTAAELYG
jgi:predicted phosphodiesterase